MEADFAFAGQSIVQTLQGLAAYRPMPRAITVDNKTKFISRVLNEWGHVACAGQHRGGHRRLPVKRRSARVQHCVGLLHMPQDRPASHDVLPARVREIDVACGAIQKRDSQLALRRGERARHGRRRDAEILGDRGEAAPMASDGSSC